MLRAIAACLLVTSVAWAQPVSFDLKNDVPQGKKPSLSVTAVERVVDLKIELTRDDGKSFTVGQPALGAGKSASFNIGDGKAGKAHYQGKLSLVVPGRGPWSFDLKFDTLIRAPLDVRFDYEHLDLASRVLQFQMSRPAGRAELVVTGESGEQLGLGRATFKGEPAGTWLSVPWQQAPGNIMILHLKVYSTDSLVQNVELIPWSLSIEHDDVSFTTDSAEISPSEAGKLDASLVKIQEAVKRAEGFVKVKLYVAGHTDTVGNKDHNRKLSVDRARAIAQYFRQHGVKIPIAYEGFGEDSLKVETADDADEAKNRRADYVIGAQAAPPPRGLVKKGVRGDWKSVP